MLDLSALPQIDPAVARVHDALLSVPPLPVAIGEYAISVAWHLPRALGPAAIPIQCESPLGSFSLTLDAALVDALSDLVLPGWRLESPAALLPGWRIACATEALLAATPLAAEGTRVRLRTPDHDGDPARAIPPAALGGTVELAGAVFGIRLDGATGDPGLVELRCRALTQPAGPDARVKFPVTCRIGRVTLDGARCRGLGTGDVVMLPGQRAEADGVRLAAELRLPGGIRWAGELCEDGHFEARHQEERDETMTDMTDPLPPEEDFHQLDDSDVTEQGGDADDAAGAAPAETPDPAPAPARGRGRGRARAAAATPAAEPPVPMDDLPVALDIQFHRQLVPLGKLSGLGEGQFLDLGIDLGQPIRILANEHPAGTGRLVQIGDRIGVRIERWRFGRPDAGP
jgi:type III secretion system YscQ/HrcQ family protein